MKNRLKKVTIKNYRSIGSLGVEIELNDIVALVGQNNSGKSSILKALELISQGSSTASLEEDDFHNNDCKNIPEVIVETAVFEEDGLGKEWIIDDDNGKYVKEKWTWVKPGEPPQRTAYNASTKKWTGIEENQKTEKFPWGPDGIAKTKRPTPHIVDPFDSPEKQSKEVLGILTQLLKSKVASVISDEKTKDNNKFDVAVSNLSDLRKSVVKAAETEITDIQTRLNTMVGDVFSGYKVLFDPKPDEKIEDVVTNALLSQDSKLKMGPETGYLSPIEKQGAGARRTLLWIALKLTSELSANKTKGRPKKTNNIPEDRNHILLLNEPEICLHPSAIRDARDTLYKLPESKQWQVMITTHSPIFVDLSKDNTTIIRVEKNADGDVSSETVFRPDSTKLETTDKENLKLMNIYDPYFAEFFFAKHVIVVEGDTEYSVFSLLLQERGVRDIHIIRARGKGPIITVVKILNQFKSSYSVLHDSDLPTRKDGKKNSSWSLNKSILDEFNKKTSKQQARLVASIKNFEHACFGKEVDNEKPYFAIKSIENSQSAARKKAIEILDALVDTKKPIPDGFLEWSNLSDLEKQINK